LGFGKCVVVTGKVIAQGAAGLFDCDLLEPLSLGKGRQRARLRDTTSGLRGRCRDHDALQPSLNEARPLTHEECHAPWPRGFRPGWRWIRKGRSYAGRALSLSYWKRRGVRP